MTNADSIIDAKTPALAADSFKKRALPAMYLGGLLALLALVASFFGTDHIQSAVSEMMIYVTIVVGLSIFIGNSGIVSFGHISFALIGVYASVWQSCCGPLRSIYMPGLPEFLATWEVNPFIAMLTGSALAAAVAFLIGAAIMRLSGTAASIATLCLLFVVKNAYENWEAWTGGQSAIVGLAPFVSLPLLAAIAVLTVVVAIVYKYSSAGLLLRAVREDEPAARASGVNVWWRKLISFTLSAFFVAIGGVLFGHFLGTITVGMYWLDMTFLTIAMLVIGGLRSVSGAVIGVVFVSVIRELLQAAERGVSIGTASLHVPEGTREIVLAIVLLAILIFRPGGLIGDRELGERP